jgi:uncharacterized protein
MKLLINNISVSIYDNIECLSEKIAKRLSISKESILNFRIVRQSVDARKKSDIKFVINVIVELEENQKYQKDIQTRISNQFNYQTEQKVGNIPLKQRPIVIGSGPAGIFCALHLARNGFKPIVIERGKKIEERDKDIKIFCQTGVLNPQSNIQFGEGGAGTFSDGKLMTRISDPRCEVILDELYKMGAPEEILIKAKPHIGSDYLKIVVKNIREKICSLGGEFIFESNVTGLKVDNDILSSVTINEQYTIDTQIAILAIGHSARDTFEMLLKTPLILQQKNFSIGVRIEHPVELIDKAQYGTDSLREKLGPAEYQLSEKIGSRTVYTFCMCPGGFVVPAASEEKTIVTNGMSNFSRDSQNSNSAVVVNVGSNDFESDHPLAGIRFQRILEKKAFEIAGSTGAAPVQLFKDFLRGEKSHSSGKVKPLYQGQIEYSNINGCLPAFACESIKTAITCFDKKIKGFAYSDAILTGVETRTSSPVRILRSSMHTAEGVEGLYPAGEGAGYAGGIMSSAVDGLKTAERIIEKYCPKY